MKRSYGGSKTKSNCTWHMYAYVICGYMWHAPASTFLMATFLGGNGYGPIPWAIHLLITGGEQI